MAKKALQVNSLKQSRRTCHAAERSRGRRIGFTPLHSMWPVSCFIACPAEAWHCHSYDLPVAVPNSEPAVQAVRRNRCLIAI
jgi:hypothetical protein